MTGPSDTLKRTAELVSAYVAHNKVPAKELETLLRSVHHACLSICAGEPEHRPAVAIKASVTPDHLICLEDGKRLKMLKRYLRGRFGMTPEDYRAKWKLPSDYPMTAPNYAMRRSELAKTIGLGRDGVRRQSAKRTVRGGRASYQS